MGCGCNKQKAAAVPANRNTVYQVIAPDQTIVGEFSSLPEARTMAVNVSGRVKVTSVQNV